MEQDKLKNILEAALMASSQPLSIDRLTALFGDDEDAPVRQDIREALDALTAESAARGVELVEVASGYRFQVKEAFAQWVSRLWEERPARYSRALLETLALIAYRQPITRGEIEDVRGVSVSSSIVKTLLDREWVRVVGHREVPGKPAMYGTTKQFLDYFGLKSLGDLPELSELRDLDSVAEQLDLQIAEEQEAIAATAGERWEGAVHELPAPEAARHDETTSELEPVAVGDDKP